MLELTQEDRGGWHVVAARGRADALTSEKLEAGLRAAVEGNPQVAANLAAVDYISSCGVRAILNAARIAQDRGVRFAVCGISAPVRKVFEISQLHHVLEICEELPC
jgi:anti-anti-sigma factor